MSLSFEKKNEQLSNYSLMCDRAHSPKRNQQTVLPVNNNEEHKRWSKR